LACLGVAGIFHQDSHSSSREIYFGSLIASKILLVKQRVGFVVKSRQLATPYHLVDNDSNKIVAIPVLIALVPPDLEPVLILLNLPGLTAPMSKKAIKPAPKQQHKAFLS